MAQNTALKTFYVRIRSLNIFKKRVGLVTRRLLFWVLVEGVNNQRSFSPSIPQLRRDPWAGAKPSTAALCSGCVFTVCVCVCVCVVVFMVCVCVCLCSWCVCVHLDGWNAEHKLRVWVTILGHTSLHFQFFTFKMGLIITCQ